MTALRFRTSAVVQHPTVERRRLATPITGLHDHAPEPAYDDIVRLAVMLCDVPAAAVTMLDRGGQWFKAEQGLGIASLPRGMTLCEHTVQGRDVFEVGNVPVTEAGPLRIGGEPIRFYAGVPLLDPDGLAIGTLCVLDTRPRALTAAQREGLVLLARQTRHLLELRRYVLDQRAQIVEGDARARRNDDVRADLERRNEQLAYSANHDPLTGLLNRAALKQMRRDGDAMARLDAGAYTLMLLDVDHFKQVNDRHGHLLGDRALRAVADAVQASIRDSDAAVRYGGEEILVVMPSTRLSAATEVGQQIRARVADADLPFVVTVSIGVATGEPGVDTPEQVFERADQALYRAKATGRDRIVADDTQRI